MIEDMEPDDFNLLELPPAVVRIAGQDKKYTSSVSQKQIESKSPTPSAHPKASAAVISGALQVSLRDASNIKRQQPRAQSLDLTYSPRVPGIDVSPSSPVPMKNNANTSVMSVMAPANLPRPQQSLLAVPMNNTAAAERTDNRSRSKSPGKAVASLGRPFEAVMDSKTAEQKQKEIMAFFGSGTTGGSDTSDNNNIASSSSIKSPTKTGNLLRDTLISRTLKRQDSIEKEFDALADTAIAEVGSEAAAKQIFDSVVSSPVPFQQQKSMTKCRSLDSTPTNEMYNLTSAYAQYSEYISGSRRKLVIS
jgi:hypothetical protein